MKKIIALLTLVGLTCIAAPQTKTDLTLITPTVKETLTIEDQADDEANTIYVTNGVLWQANSSRTNQLTRQICELSFKEDATQGFTGGGGYQIITNLLVNYTDGACLTATTTGMVVGVSGFYQVDHGASLASTTGASDIECDLYADESDVADISGQEVHWKVEFAANNITGFKGFSRIVYLTAGQFVSLRIDPAAGTDTVKWFSGNLRLTYIRK